MIIRFNCFPRPYRISRFTSLLIRRTYLNPQTTQEYEKLKYDQLVNERLLRDTIKQGVTSGNSINNGEPRLQNSRRLPLSTVILLIAVGSSVSMAVYILVEYRKFIKESKIATSEGVVTTRSLFLPLWFHTDWFHRKRYQFPSGIKYFDQDYFGYIETEMDQLNQTGDKDENLKNYCTILEQENVKYTVLQKLSSNLKVKQTFGLPLNLDSIDISQFKIWVELKYRSISGIRIDISRKTNGTDQATEIAFSWCIKPINFGSIINSMLIQLGLKLDRLESSNAEIKTHEKSSGKIHEMKLEKKKLVLNKNRDYDIIFTGKLLVMDKLRSKSGVLTYKGIIDFDHLMINRGIKIISMDLQSDKSDKVSYKIL